MFYDNPKITYENPPPPSDYESEEDISIFFSFPRPQSVTGTGFPNIDYTLIHPSLLGIKSEENIENIEKEVNESGQKDAGKENSENIDENLEHRLSIKREENIEIDENEVNEIGQEDAVKDVSENIDENLEHRFSIKREENEVNEIGQEDAVKDVSENIDENLEHRFSIKREENEVNEIGQEDAVKDVSENIDENLEHIEIDENEVNEIGQKDAVKDVSENIDENLEQLNEIYNLKLTTPDKEKTNRKKQKKKKSKETKNSRKVKDKWSDILQEEENASTGKKKRKCHKRKKSKRVKSTSDSDDERNVNNIGIEVISESYLKEFETSAKHSNHIKSSKHSNFKYSRPCVVSDNDHSSYSDEPIRSDSFLRKSKESRSVYSDDEHSLSDRSETSHKKRYLRSPKIKVKQEVFSDDDNSSYFERLSRRRFRNSDDSNDSASYHSRSHRKRYSDDDEHDRISEYYSLKREVKQDTVLESEDCKDSEEFSGSYYCKICKLTLNSESTWQSHKLGKRHAKAERAQEVHKVVKSSLLPSTSTSFPEEGNRYDKPPPGMKRIELKDAVSSIERACDDLPNRQLIGLKHVWEIREEAETFYYCNLCDAPCAASSIGLHVIGFKHKFRCLKEYFPDIYDRYKYSHKKRVEGIMEDIFYDYAGDFGKEKVRVFQDIPVSDIRRSSTYPSDQPGPSWQVDPFPGTKQETVVVKDENGKSIVPSNQEFLDTSYSDFYCTVCDSHMNNIAMWEAHVRGKRHLKNMKKAPQGIPATSKYVEAPKGTKSYLRKKIKEECKDMIVVGLDYIRENQGKNGNQYNCFLCGGCSSDIDIIPHILSLKHKEKYLEKMNIDGYKNGIMEINSLDIRSYFRERLIDDSCQQTVAGKEEKGPQIYYLKRDL